MNRTHTDSWNTWLVSMSVGEDAKGRQLGFLQPWEQENLKTTNPLESAGQFERTAKRELHNL